MSVTALLAAAAIPLGPAQANAQAEFVARDSFGGVVTGGALFYSHTPAGRSSIMRMDLGTGERRIVYRSPNRRTSVSNVEAGGGRVAFETQAGITRPRLFAMEASGGPVVQLARGRTYYRRDCGRDVRLHDVSPSGVVLYEEARVRCGRRSGTAAVRAYDPATGTRTLETRGTHAAFISDGPPHRALAGEQLLTYGERHARVRELASGRVRRLEPLTRRSELGLADVAADGRVLLTEWTGRARRPQVAVRLVGAGGSGRAGAVGHRSRREFGEARFCGEHPVLGTMTLRGRLRLSVLDPPGRLAEGLLPEPDTQEACDERHFVVTVAVPGTPDRVYVYELPGG